MKKIITMLVLTAILLCGCGINEKGEPKRGILKDGVYINEYFDIEFKFNEDEWEFYDDETIAEIYGEAEELLYPEGEEFGEMGYISDVYGVNNKDSAITISYENISQYYEEFDEKEYTEISIESLKEYMEIETGEYKQKDGFTYIDIIIVPLSEKGYERLCTKKVGNWMAVIAISGNSVEEIENIFGGLNA